MIGKYRRKFVKLKGYEMKKRMKMAAAVMAAVMGMMTLGGCGTASEKSKTAALTESQAEGTDAKQASEDGKSQDLKEINVVLDWYPNAIHTFIYTAIERGYYAEEGLDVKVRFPANANDALSLVAAGKAEIGMYYQQDVIQAVANQGTKIKSIGAIVQSPLSVVLSLKDKNITGPENLVGKTVGYGGTALSEAVVKSMMEYVGADASDVNLIDVGFELMSSMTTGNVDATIGCLVNHEVPQMEKEGFEVNYFFPDDLLHHWPEHIRFHAYTAITCLIRSSRICQNCRNDQFCFFLCRIQKFCHIHVIWIRLIKTNSEYKRIFLSHKITLQPVSCDTKDHIHRHLLSYPG